MPVKETSVLNYVEIAREERSFYDYLLITKVLLVIYFN